MQAAERIGKAGGEKLGHFRALLIRKARVLPVRLWVFDVDLLMRDVQIAAVNDRLFRVQPQQIRAQRVFPLHAVWKALEAVLRIGRIAADEIEFRVLRRDEPTFVVVRVKAQPILDGKRGLLRQNRRAGIALFLGGIKIAMIAVQLEDGLLRLELRLLQAGVCDLTGKITPYWVHENKDDVPVYLPNANGEVLNNDFYGGNLNGIREKLPYLHALGVEILYLNPIFYAWSTHRYDTCDYKRIDPMLGSEADFRALCGAAHALGMKIILDGVFSHVGSRSAYFQQAIHDPASPYRGWFRFKQYPNVYDSWWGITTLPCIDKLNPDYMDYIIDSDDSVVVRWLKLGADGWRLDVVDELPDAFLARLRERIRQVKPDAILIGEVWEDASNKIAYDCRRRYFTDRQLDSVMNYPWQKAILRYVRGEDDGTGLGASIRTIAENYPPDVLQAVMNILSTHDTPRAINAILDPRDGDRAELARRHFTAEQLAEGKKRLKMAAFLQFMLPGMPCIYYGDEAGMTGYRDPFNRAYYPWGREDGNLISFYRSLARVKKASPALRRGTVLVLEAGGGRLMLLRQYEGKNVAVCCNRSENPWTLPHSGTILLGGGIAEYTGETLTLGCGGFCAMERE